MKMMASLFILRVCRGIGMEKGPLMRSKTTELAVAHRSPSAQEAATNSKLSLKL